MQTENTYIETDLGNIALNLRGEYSDETSYEYLDTVSYMGGSYVCLAELTKTISEIAPEEGKNTEHWQMLTLPGGLTSDYIAMHDDVVNKAKQVETSRAAVELSQQEVEAAQADVSQMRQDTQDASQMAIASRDNAAGYAQSAEISRTAAKESEDNVKAQESKVVQSVIDEGTKQIKAVSDKATEHIGTINTTGSKQVSIIETKGADQVKEIQKAGKNALQNISNSVDKGLSEEGKAADAKATGEAISKLTEDLDNIKKKKNVVIYVGSSELSDEQKLSCDYICDGVDDQIEINQAIDSLPDSGGEIHLSRGIFNITNSITIRKRIKLTGEGKGITLDRNNVNNGGTTLLSELTGGCIILIEKSDTLADIKGITLSDFQIVGAGINVENNFCNGINITTYTDCVTLERLAICHCFYGLFVDQSATVDDISVANCDFQRDSCGIAIYGQGWQTRIENNIFWDMHGGHSTTGVILSAGKNIVNGNYFGVSALVKKGVANSWISAKNAVSLLCNGNSFSKCTSSPIRFEAGGQFASISGNSFSEIGKAQFYSNERAVLYVDGAGTGGGRISFTNNTVFWANDDTWKTSYLAYLTNQVAQVNISNNTVIDGIGKITEDELVYKSEDSAYAITIGNNVLC